tara:strand:- start:6768 stop:6938 length:171 start_codon:yes stop_codon:yes gene_type:complete
MQWLLLGFIGYLLYRMWRPIYAIFDIKKRYQTKYRKNTVRSKIEKMDILEADYEDK